MGFSRDIRQRLRATAAEGVSVFPCPFFDRFKSWNGVFNNSFFENVSFRPSVQEPMDLFSVEIAAVVSAAVSPQSGLPVIFVVHSPTPRARRMSLMGFSGIFVVNLPPCPEVQKEGNRNHWGKGGGRDRKPQLQRRSVAKKQPQRGMGGGTTKNRKHSGRCGWEANILK